MLEEANPQDLEAWNRTEQRIYMPPDGAQKSTRTKAQALYACQFPRFLVPGCAAVVPGTHVRETLSAEYTRCWKAYSGRV